MSAPQQKPVATNATKPAAAAAAATARPATAKPAATASAKPSATASAPSSALVRPATASVAPPAVPAAAAAAASATTVATTASSFRRVDPDTVDEMSDTDLLNHAKSVPRVPGPKTLEYASRLSIILDKPILLDYYIDSVNRKAFMGVTPGSSETILIKNKSEYTSPISRKFTVGEDKIVITENSIYVVAANIANAKFNQ